MKCVFLASLGLCASAWAAPPLYTVIDLGPQQGGEGLVWQGLVGTPTPAGFPSTGTIYSSTQTPTGRVMVGAAAVQTGLHAAKWELPAGTGSWQMTDLGVLPNASEASAPPSSYAYGLNRKGDVVGVSNTDSTQSNSLQTSVHAVLWSNGSAVDLGAIAGPQYSSAAEGVNDSGEIVGNTQTIVTNGQTAQRAFLYTGGKMYNLTFYEAGGARFLLSDATAIDCQGNISAVGTAASGGNTHSYLLLRQGPLRNCTQ